MGGRTAGAKSFRGICFLSCSVFLKCFFPLHFDGELSGEGLAVLQTHRHMCNGELSVGEKKHDAGLTPFSSFNVVVMRIYMSGPQ